MAVSASGWTVFTILLISRKMPGEDNNVVPGSLLTSGSSNYLVQSILGQGTFGKVVKCRRLNDMKTVAIKMIQKLGYNQTMAYREVATLKKLRSLELNKCNLVQWYAYFIDRGHICLEFEHLDKSLLDFMKEQSMKSFPLKEIRPIVQQIAHALKYLKAAKIVHADLKFDNVMMVDQLREPFRVKVIDFGLACEVSAANIGSYIQTRPYRSPEIILGHPFTEAIDMWSLGCMAAAMYLGALLYPGVGEYEMIKFIVETQGQPPDTILNNGCKTLTFFKKDVTTAPFVWKIKTPEEYYKKKGRQPMENRRFKFTSLDDLLHIRLTNRYNSADRITEKNDLLMFVDMLKGMLHLDPEKRITPCQVLEHNFISMRHIASMDYHSNYVKTSFQMMEICHKQIQTSDSPTAVCGSVKKPAYTATNPVQHHQTKLHLCTTKQTRETDGSRKWKVDHEDVPPHKKSYYNRRFQGNYDYSRNRKYGYNFVSPSNSRHYSWHTWRHQSDQRTRPADHLHHSTLTGSQAQSGQKRKAGHDEDEG